MSTDLSDERQLSMDEITVEDQELEGQVIQWASMEAQKKKLAAQIKELGIDDLKDQVKAKLQDYGISDAEDPKRFRIGTTGLVVKVTPPGPAKEINFTSRPQLRLSLQTPSDA